MNERRLRVALGERSYDIVVGAGLLREAGALMAPVLRQKRVVIVTDETVAGLHLARFAASLAAAGIRHQAVAVPPGSPGARSPPRRCRR